MSFRDGGFSKRFGTMGDTAEHVFEDVYAEGWARYGLNRPPINLSTVPAYIRFTPDYITKRGLVECQGFGKDQTAKFKWGKLEALKLWHQQFRVDWFLFDSFNARYGWVRLPELLPALDEHAETRTFHEGNPYYAIKASNLPVVGEWYEYPEPMKKAER